MSATNTYALRAQCAFESYNHNACTDDKQSYCSVILKKFANHIAHISIVLFVCF